MFPWRAVIEINKASEKAYLFTGGEFDHRGDTCRASPARPKTAWRQGHLVSCLGLNRKTIVAAMDELNSQGWIESFVHKGTFVSSRLPTVEYQSLPRKATTRQVKKRLPSRINDPSFLESLYLEQQQEEND